MSLRDLDMAALLFARTHGHARRAERVIAGFSRTGEHGACWIALGLLGSVTSDDHARRVAWLRGAGVVVVAYALNYGVKLVVRRPRPQLVGLPPLTATVSRLSFPSAHATTSFAAAQAFRGLAPAGALDAVACAFALSRPYLGVHYPSDVLAGAVLGTALGRALAGGGVGGTAP